MSLLLDALNKADQERKRSDGTPSINSSHDDYPARTDRKISSLVIVFAMGVLLIVLLIVVYWLGKHTQQTSTEMIVPAANITTVIPELKTESAAINHSQANIKNENIASEKNRGSEKISEDENVASLYQQPTTNAVPAPTISDSVVIPTVSATPINSAEQPAASPTSITQFANLPEIQDLPNSILEKIPNLKYTEHHYNSNGGSVVINGTVWHANDQLADGLVIDKILEDGMILHFQNYSFKMRALNTWINM